MLLAGALLYGVNRWRLRLDETGLARRRLWRWDVWTWDEFTHGQLIRQGRDFVSTARPWWRNRLTFCFLNHSDQAFVSSVCRFFYRPPEERHEECSDQNIAIRYQLLCNATFHKDCFVGRTGFGRFELDWSQVREVRLHYFDHESRELRKIELDLPSRTLRIEGINSVYGMNSGPHQVRDPKVIPRVVADFLDKHLPPGKLVRHALYGPPQTLHECDRRRCRLQRELRFLTWCYRILPLGCLILGMVCFGPKLAALWGGGAGLPHGAWLGLATLLTLAAAGGQPLTIWALLWELHRRHTSALSELDAWRRRREAENASREFLVRASA